MPLKKILLTALVAFLAGSSGCFKPAPTPEEMERISTKLNKTTMSIAVALKSMRNTEQIFTEQQFTPRKVDLDTWWICLTSTRLNMKRVLATITEHPSSIDLARNFWAGRIQENLNLMIDSGMFTTMQGPVTSKLESNYGAERVNKETEGILSLSQQIEDMLDLSNTASPD